MPNPFRVALGSVLLLGGLLLINACGTAESTRQTPSSRTLQLTAIDSLSGQPLDSARAVNRTLGDTLYTDSAGVFVLRDLDPGLYVFDVTAYGYHPQRHVSALIESRDTSFSVEAHLLRQRLTIDCESARPYFWDAFVEEYRDDSTQVQLRLIDVFAEKGQVRVQPVIVNDLSAPTFFPENYGALGHYDIQLYTSDNERIAYTYEDAPRDEGHRIYSEKGDIYPVVPGEVERLEPSTLLLEEKVPEDETLFARMNYTFSTSDTLESTSATTFPDLNIDSLQVADFDTVRTDGRMTVPDTLIIQRDTSVMDVVDIDTTVSRNGYTLFSTLRDSNAAQSAQAALDLLFIPDSVKVRARRDSLRAIVDADTTVPEIDTSRAPPPEDRPRLDVVSRTDTSRVVSLIPEGWLSESLPHGLPGPEVSADSLLAMSSIVRQAYLQPPDLPMTGLRTGFQTEVDTTGDSLIASAPTVDSLFSLFRADTSIDEGDAPLLSALPATEERAPGLDSVPFDSVRYTVPPESDSVVIDSTTTATLSNPPPRSHWFVPDSLSIPGARILVVDPSFYDLRARPRVDTTGVGSLDRFIPKRIGPREQLAHEEYPQQVIRAPAGTYQSSYLKVWKALQENRLKQLYCQIFPFPIRSDWSPATIH